MIKKIFSAQINSITIAALLVAFSSLLSRLLGIFRDRILAGEFGAGDSLDIYYAAFRVPDLVFNLVVLGALSAGFIPIFAGLIKKFNERKGENEAWELTSIVINILSLSILLISIIGIIFAPLITKLTVPGFSDEKQIFTANLSRIMFLSPLFLGISGILGGVLQSFKRFFIYALSPIAYNIGIIIGALFLVPLLGLYGLAWGVVLGSFLHMLVQIPAVIKLGFKYKFSFNYKNEYARKIFIMMMPRTMSLAISQIDLMITTIIASMLASGSLAIFNFANNLQIFPVGIFGISFAVAAFPTLSLYAFDKKKLISNYSQTLRNILFFIIPSTVCLLVLRAQIIRVILGTGNFDWNATILTMNTLAFFSISLFAQAIIPLQVRIFYARHNSKTPFYVGLFTACLDIILSYFLSKLIGVAGLALAFSISTISNFIILWFLLRKELGNMDEEKILISITKFTGAGLAAGIAIQSIKNIVWPFINMHKFWGIFTQGILSGIAGILVYLAFCSLFQSEELSDFWKSFKKRFLWKKIEVDDQGEARGI